MKSIAELPEPAVDLGRPCAFLADLHANLEALTAAVTWLEARGLDQVVVLGDLVGYGASPAAVVDAVRERGWPALVGNHEELVLGRERGVRTGLVKERARRAIEWTRRQLSPAHLAFLDALPPALRIGEAQVLVHGSLVDPLHCYAYIYDLSLDLNVRRLRELAAPPGTVVFYGHTHWPKVFRVEDEIWSEESARGERVLRDDARYFVNPGSVGYPRDGDPRAALLVWEPARRRLEHVRLPYDVEAAAARIEAAGYAPEIAARLREAR